MFACDMTDRSKYINCSYNSISQKETNYKMGKNRHFSKEEYTKLRGT